MSTSTTFKALAAVSASAALAIAGAGTAAAQGNSIPGDDYDGRTVLVNDGETALEIVSIDRETGQVELSMTNTTGAALRCEAASTDERNRPGSTVSTAETILRAENFYERYQLRSAEEIDIGFDVGFVGGADINVPFWPLLQFLPSGSAAAFLSDRYIAQQSIVTGHTDAKQRGLAGTSTGFTINNDATNTWTIQMNRPAVSPRGEDSLGAIVMCGAGGTQDNQQLYAWTTYQEGWTPEDTEDSNSGSLAGGSLGTGEQGSASAGSLGSTGTDPVDPGDPDAP